HDLPSFPTRRSSDLDLDNARRAEIRPSELFLARPNNFNRTPRRARQSSGFNCRIASVLPSICRAGVGHNHAHTALWQVKYRSKRSEEHTSELQSRFD